ncbi:MAG TPA: SDR family oxidoreductase [Firmicutes bacterium]|jgi:NAD(P)-dependent dehydrogenase (short-subunit alcohol dehydrogenase family)|nr:SDR family oxidoreductase [Bacillota bacterium]HHT43474.1 SDR family oxidoreductase [Bacillota bacterium]
MGVTDLFDLRGRVAVITGGTGVLGSELSRGLASARARVAVLGRDATRRDAVVSDILRAGGEAVGIACDVLDRESLLAARAEVLERLGTVDILVNGAGGNRPAATTSSDLSFFDLPEEALNHVVQLNFMGTLLPTQIFGQVLAEKKEGVILNVSSMSSFQPMTRVVGYSAAKAAVNNLTQWLAVHFCQNYSPKIRVNAIAPGFFLTEQNRFLLTDEETGELTARGRSILDNTPMGRFGEPADLVGTVIWLVSDASRFVTGTVVPVDGGFAAFSGV